LSREAAVACAITERTARGWEITLLVVRGSRAVVATVAVDGSVTAELASAELRAPVAIRPVPIVTLLRRLHDPIAAPLQAASTGAAIAAPGVPIVTLLVVGRARAVVPAVRVEESIAAPLRATRRTATVAVRSILVVALLIRVDRAVPARRFDEALRRAPVTVRGIPVVALLVRERAARALPRRAVAIGETRDSDVSHALAGPNAKTIARPRGVAAVVTLLTLSSLQGPRHLRAPLNAVVPRAIAAVLELAPIRASIPGLGDASPSRLHASRSDERIVATLIVGRAHSPKVIAALPREGINLSISAVLQFTEVCA